MEQGPFLGVEQSLTGKRWLERPCDDRIAQALAQRFELPEVIGRVLAARGVGLNQAEAFLDPTLRRLLPDPSHLLDMDKGAERIVRAIVDGEQIAVFGDYDVDGATAAALLRRFLVAVGASTPRLYVPDRLAEGYGPNTAALLALNREGASLVITVDCGITAHQSLSDASGAGLDVIVVDHHAASEGLPPALAVINPNRLDETSPHRHLAAVGVAFLLVVAVNRLLRERGWYEGSVTPPDLRQWLDLVALGTVCDVVPLAGVNRAFVAQGLKVMGWRRNTGLRALADVAGIAEAPGTYHVGFVLGPRINAGGRVGKSDLGARLLACDDAIEAAEIAGRLNDFNNERQRIEREVLKEANAQLANDDDHAGVVIAHARDWHPGVVGIVASRLVETFNRPALVIALDGDLGTGSARSIAGFDIGAAVAAARHCGLLLKGGGHAMAAGLTVERGRIEELRSFFNERLAASPLEIEARPTLSIDGVLCVSGASPGVAAELSRAGPFGAGNPEPRFAITGARLAKVAPAGADHLRCTLVDGGGERLDGIAFRCREGALGAALPRLEGTPVTVAGRLRESGFRGRPRIQLHIDDAAVG